MNGILYGVGVGPGAPDLLTLRAVNVLRRVDVILAAASPRNDGSTALDTARPHLRPNTRVESLNFPMTHEIKARLNAWREAAKTTLSILESGLNAAFLTIGDPLIYSTFGYLMQTLARLAPHITVEVIPGITAYQAAAARTRTVLCADRESLLLLPGINRRQDLEDALEYADTAVILKAYRNLPAIHKALQSCGRAEDGIFASLVERPGETVRQGLPDPETTPPYMSLILSRKPGSR